MDKTGKKTKKETQKQKSAITPDNILFMNACRLGTSWFVYRYLMANTSGRANGFEKAEQHMNLCCYYIATYKGLKEADSNLVRRHYEELYRHLHKETGVLTDHLDKVIGFPFKETEPEVYDELNPYAEKFFQEFHAIAMRNLVSWEIISNVIKERKP